MTIFAIMLPTPTPAIAEAIRRSYPLDHLAVNETQWLISSRETAADVSNKLGITGPTSPSTGNAIVFATSSYFGRAPATVWDWIKVKLEASGG
jgi:hypothetical protein